MNKSQGTTDTKSKVSKLSSIAQAIRNILDIESDSSLDETVEFELIDQTGIRAKMTNDKKSGELQNNEIEELVKRLEELKLEYRNAHDDVLRLMPNATAPSISALDNLEDDALRVPGIDVDVLTVEQHRFIKELLCEIREFDGTSDVEAFLTQIRNAKVQLKTPGERRSLVRKIVAMKLKGDAQRVAERNRCDDLLTLGEAMRTAFGRLELEYEQLAEERNSMRQGISESVNSYIQRYEEIDKRIQCSIDSMNGEFRDITRHMESRQNVGKFIRGLRKEIRLEVKLASPENLRTAFQIALKEEKYFKDDEVLRRRQEHQPMRSIPATPRYPARSIPTKEGPRLAAAVVAERERGQAPPSRERARAREESHCSYCKRTGHTVEQCYSKNPENRRNFQLRPSTFKGPPKQINYEDQQEEARTLSHEQETIEANKKDQIEWLGPMGSIGRYGSNWAEPSDSATSSSIREHLFQL